MKLSPSFWSLEIYMDFFVGEHLGIYFKYREPWLPLERFRLIYCMYMSTCNMWPEWKITVYKWAPAILMKQDWEVYLYKKITIQKKGAKVVAYNDQSSLLFHLTENKLMKCEHYKQQYFFTFFITNWGSHRFYILKDSDSLIYVALSRGSTPERVSDIQHMSQVLATSLYLKQIWFRLHY